jgi:hypothetical protein
MKNLFYQLGRALNQPGGGGKRRYHPVLIKGCQPAPVQLSVISAI